MQQLLSLYDYLGRAAGPELGREVASYAKSIKATYGIRHIENKKYKGPVHLYEPNFLESYFSSENNREVITRDREAYAKKLTKKYQKEASTGKLLF